ncbi:2Fe-2S iron-sulfur cluster-binding protein [Buchnera aphidicola]|uniref:2Fe-2S iron-sulfur cluster-binding protein n=1 Tax=Buchnera aphidicola TaxID=9 RepID=UPI0031B7FA5B
MNSKTLNYKKKKYSINLINKNIILITKNVNRSLLEILVSKNINIPYQCQNGFCGTCKIRLIHGKIKYFKKNIFSFHQQKYIFPCCCTPMYDISIII